MALDRKEKAEVFQFSMAVLGEHKWTEVAIFITTWGEQERREYSNWSIIMLLDFGQFTACVRANHLPACMACILMCTACLHVPASH